MLYPLSYRGGDQFVCGGRRRSLKKLEGLKVKNAPSAARETLRTIQTDACPAEPRVYLLSMSNVMCQEATLISALPSLPG